MPAPQPGQLLAAWGVALYLRNQALLRAQAQYAKVRTEWHIQLRMYQELLIHGHIPEQV